MHARIKVGFVFIELGIDHALHDFQILFLLLLNGTVTLCKSLPKGGNGSTHVVDDCC